jgi:hypothetical protein
MESLILTSLSIYFFFFLLNYASLGAGARRFLDFHAGLAKTDFYGSFKAYVITLAHYPLRVCAFCFSFWANFVFFQSFWILTGGSVVVLLLDLAVKRLAGLKNEN